MPLAGGPSTVAGTRYEYRWTALRFLDVLSGEAASIRVEPPGEDGFEFVLERPGGAREYHQVKRSHPKGTWTLNALESGGVLENFIKKLAVEPRAACIFFSGAEARDLRELSDRARVSVGWEEFQSKFLTSELREGFDRIKLLSGSAAAAYEQLKRVEVRTCDEQLLLELAVARCRQMVAGGHPRNVVDVLAQLAMDQTHVPLDASKLRELLRERGLSLAAALHTGAWRRPQPWNVPQRPAEYLLRDELGPLKLSLIASGTQAVAITGEHQRLGIQGMPGVGKTVLAAALATDPDIQDAFPGGVFWLTLGQTPDDVIVCQGNLAEALAGHRVEIRTAREGKTKLRELFAARPPSLLILDDVWNIADADPFDAPTAPSRLLVTTRNQEVAKGLGATVREIRELKPADALTMLAAYAGRPMDTLPKIAHDIVRECGELPLAVAMAGAMLQGRPDDQWPTLLDQLKNADLKYLAAGLPQYRQHRSMLAAIEVSVQELAEDVRLRYLDLAVFPEDTQVPERVLHRLWGTAGVPLFAAQQTVNMLADRSLVRRVRRARSRDGDRRADQPAPPPKDEEVLLTLHDLQHDYVRARGGDLAPRHARLVEAYRSTSPGRALHSVEADGYFFEHIARHVRDGEGPAALRALLFDHRWLAAKLKAAGVNALLADFELIDLASDRPLRLLRDALRLSGHVVAQHPEELSSQLLGRLRTAAATELRHLGACVEADAALPSLLPLWSSLTSPGGPLLCTLEGHTGPVNALALNADGKRVVSGSSDGTLKVWDVEAVEALRTLEGHTSWVNAVMLSADGKTAISGSGDTTLKVWDVETGHERRTLKGHAGWVRAVVLSADGKTVISGSEDRTLKVWDVETDHECRTLKGHAGSVNAVALSTDGRRAISGSGDKTLKVWDVETGEVLHTFKGHAGSVRTVALSVDGRRAISGSGDKTLKVWDVETGEALHTFKGHTGSVRAVALSADGRRAISGSGDKTLKVWDVETGEVFHTLHGHADWVHAVALSADGKRAVSGSNDKTLKVWEVLETSETLRKHEGHDGSVSSVVLYADGERAVSGSSNGTLKVWDMQTGEALRALKGHARWMNTVALSADGRRAVTGSGDRTLKVWDMETGEVLRTLKGHAGSVRAMVMSADGKRAVSASNDKTVKVWDLETGEVFRTFRGHAETVRTLALSANGKMVVSGSGDRTLKVWDVETGEVLCTLKGHSGSVRTVALSADAKRAVSGSSDRTLKAWDVGTGEVLCTLQGHTNWVNEVVLSEDAKIAVSCSEDRTLKVWNVEMGACLISFTGDAAFNAVALSRTLRVFAGDSTGHVHVLQLRLGS